MSMIRVDYSQLQHVEQEVRRLSGVIFHQVGEMKNILAKTDYTGDSATEWHMKQTALQQLLQDISDQAGTLATVVNDSMEQYYQTEQRNVALFNG